MKILHIDEQRGWRGGEQQASYLIRGLVDRGHEILYAGRRDSAFLRADHGGSPDARIAAPFLGEWDITTAWRLARVIRRHSVDVVHAHTSHAHTHACVARTLAGRGKVVVSRRVDFVPRGSVFGRWKYGLPDRLVAISNRIADVLTEFGVPSEKLRVVHSCIDPARFDVEPLPRSDLGVPEDAPLLGNVAALVDHKDQATLIAAMPAVLAEAPATRLVIAGEGKLRVHLEDQIDRLGVGHAVRLLGYRNDIPRLLRALDVFVMSSKEEGLGTSVLDAMACSLPVAATAGGGIPEMVEDERTGLLTPVQDPAALAGAIVRLVRDKAFASALGRNARDLVLDRFTVDKMVEGNLRVYEEVVSESP